MFADYANIPVTTAFAAGINCLPSVRSTLVAAFPKIVWDGHEPRIDAVDLRSATAFTVTLNFNTVMTAEITDNGDYQVKFCGTVTQITFAAETTLTFFRVAWAQDRKNHNVPAFSVAAGTAITIEDSHGYSITASGTNEFELSEGWYDLTATCAGYEDVEQSFLYRLEDSITLHQVTSV